jgi:uncharacterized membrane protein (Fun14 family)
MSVERHGSQDLAWLNDHATSIKDFIIGYGPSSAAAVVGVFLGARRI